jgi:glucose-6-phosphate 1-epimerase
MIELRKGDIKAIIDPHGGWVTNLTNESGDIFFPKRALEDSDGTTKMRGGCHVCLPNFGSGGTSDQLQHGFGREVIWDVADIGENYALLTLLEGPGLYKELSSSLTYIIEDATFEMILEVVNDGSNGLRIAPAFHPYFALHSEDRSVMVDDENTPLETLVDTVFTAGTMQKLATKQRTFVLTSASLPVWAAWTDLLGPYVCLEPTQAGYAFLKEAPDAEEVIDPGKGKKYSLKIDWSAPS